MVTENDEEKTQPAEMEQLNPAKSRRKRWIWIITGLLVLILAGGGASLWLLRSGKGETSREEKTEDLLKADAAEGDEALDMPEDKKAEKEEKKKAHGAEHGKEDKASEGEEEEKSLVLKMEPIVANLNEPNLRRMVSLTLVVEGRDKAALTEVEKNTYRITDAIIKMLSNKTQADLQSEAGKDLLLLEIKSRIDQIIGKDKVAFVGYQQFYFFQ